MNPVSWTLNEIRAMPSRDDFITMSCISNRVGGSLISTTKWTGVSLQYILANPAVTCVLTETTSAEHMAENALAAFALVPDEGARERMRALIDAA